MKIIHGFFDGRQNLKEFMCGVICAIALISFFTPLVLRAIDIQVTGHAERLCVYYQFCADPADKGAM